jgi:hypothetical protein
MRNSRPLLELMDWRCNRGGGRTLAAAREQYIYTMRKRYFINSARTLALIKLVGRL